MLKNWNNIIRQIKIHYLFGKNHLKSEFRKNLSFFNDEKRKVKKLIIFLPDFKLFDKTLIDKND